MSVLNIIDTKQKQTKAKNKNVYAISDMNDSQKKVIEEIEKNTLITVQGAAGTGKTSTIINLAAHFVITGRTVLIVSKMDKAVDVVANRLNSLGAPLLAMRAGNKENNNNLSSILIDIVSGKFKQEEIKENNFSYFLNKMLKNEKKSQKIAIELLKKSRYEKLESLLNDTDKKKEFLIQSRAVLTTSINKRNTIMQRDFKPILEALPIWCVTTQQISAVLPLQENLFDLVIIDESSQCDIASCIPCLYRAKKAVAIGDDKQLRHLSFLDKTKEQSFLAKNNVSEELQLIWRYRSNSMFDFANFYAEKSILLDVHYRSPQNIFAFSNKEFYNNAIKCIKPYEKGALKKIFVENAQVENGINEKEIQAILADVEEYLKNNPKKTVAIVSPFTKQVEELQQAILYKFDYENLERIICTTIYGMQGDEADALFLSFCICDNSPRQSLTYIERKEVFNVAITRGRESVRAYYSTKNLGNGLLRKYIDSIK